MWRTETMGVVIREETGLEVNLTGSTTDSVLRPFPETEGTASTGISGLLASAGVDTVVVAETEVEQRESTRLPGTEVSETDTRGFPGTDATEPPCLPSTSDSTSGADTVFASRFSMIPEVGIAPELEVESTEVVPEPVLDTQEIAHRPTPTRPVIEMVPVLLHRALVAIANNFARV